MIKNRNYKSSTKVPSGPALLFSDLACTHAVAAWLVYMGCSIETSICLWPCLQDCLDRYVVVSGFAMFCFEVQDHYQVSHPYKTAVAQAGWLACVEAIHSERVQRHVSRHDAVNMAQMCLARLNRLQFALCC
jgi:hypothetical protein